MLPATKCSLMLNDCLPGSSNILALSLGPFPQYTHIHTQTHSFTFQNAIVTYSLLSSTILYLSCLCLYLHGTVFYSWNSASAICPILPIMTLFRWMSLDLNFCPLFSATGQSLVELQGLPLAVAISSLSVHLPTF